MSGPNAAAAEHSMSALSGRDQRMPNERCIKISVDALRWINHLGISRDAIPTNKKGDELVALSEPMSRGFASGVNFARLLTALFQRHNLDQAPLANVRRQVGSFESKQHNWRVVGDALRPMGVKLGRPEIARLAAGDAEITGFLSKLVFKINYSARPSARENMRASGLALFKISKFEQIQATSSRSFFNTTNPGRCILRGRTQNPAPRAAIIIPWGRRQVPTPRSPRNRKARNGLQIRAVLRIQVKFEISNLNEIQENFKAI